MRRGFAILAILLVAETTLSAGVPCCCLRRFSERAVLASSGSGARDAEEPECCCERSPRSDDEPRSRLPQREPGCPCRTVEPYALVADAPALPALDGSAGVLLPAPDLAPAFPVIAPRVPIARCGSSPPGSDVGPPSSATPALLPLRTV